MIESRGLDPFRTELLQRTVRWAVSECSFYPRHWGTDAPHIESLGDLATLPLLDKPTATAQQNAMRCGPAVVDLGSISSGTTRVVGERPLRVEHCQAELDALEDFRAALFEGSGTTASDALTLQLVSPMHGFPRPAGPTVIRLVWAPYAGVAELVRSTLATRFAGKRITEMALSLGALKELTSYFLAVGFDPCELGVERIYTFGNYLTQRWRELVTQHWEAEVFNQYGLSEFRTLALECKTCGFFHFGIPPLITEVIDPVTGSVTQRPIGELVLTGLFPFAQRQPLIRYRTRDLIEVGPACNRTQEIGLRPLGRATDVPTDDDDPEAPYSQFPLLVEEALDSLPGIARHVSDFERLCPTVEDMIGQPRFAIQSRGDSVRVAVGVTSEMAEPTRRRETLDDIQRRLRSSHADVARHSCVRCREPEIELVSPGMDPPRWIQKHAL